MTRAVAAVSASACLHRAWSACSLRRALDLEAAALVGELLAHGAGLGAGLGGRRAGFLQPFGGDGQALVRLLDPVKQAAVLTVGVGQLFLGLSVRLTPPAAICGVPAGKQRLAL
ncbi:hypothetical protein [Nonomuraea diastatica]|uniref:Uncharacterized protein n=1 Tax=Nonomuraea diastatica TaxID=1848329 RepID=A0A4R4WUB1_9ACTN|nr:hypothetical protein [Nonomuraea diastatica]TDD21231.1 hypothetical protein E1294_15405 [Nonomuraea diastatica]